MYYICKTLKTSFKIDIDINIIITINRFIPQQIPNNINLTVFLLKRVNSLNYI